MFFFNYYRTTTEVGWDYRVLIAIHPPRPYGDVTAKASPSATHAACITNCTRYCKKKKITARKLFPLWNQQFLFQKVQIINLCVLYRWTDLYPWRKTESKLENGNPKPPENPSLPPKIPSITPNRSPRLPLPCTPRPRWLLPTTLSNPPPRGCWICPWHAQIQAITIRQVRASLIFNPFTSENLQDNYQKVMILWRLFLQARCLLRKTPV